MTLKEALAIPSVVYWDVEDVPVIETSRHEFWAFAPGEPRIFSGGSVERNGGQISRKQFLDLLKTWENSK